MGLLAGKPTRGAPAAFRSAPKPYPHRVTLDLSREDFRALKLAQIDDGIATSDRLRVLIALCPRRRCSEGPEGGLM